MGKKVKVVFDTNVWVSIFMEEVLYDEFSQAKQELTVYASKDLILELSKVLLYPRIAKVLEKNSIHEKDVLRAISANSKMVESKLKLNFINEDAEDNKILECAQAAGAVFIVSGDKHLLKLGMFRKTRILSPREFFDYIIPVTKNALKDLKNLKIETKQSVSKMREEALQTAKRLVDKKLKGD